ncbi:hypothetical protein HDU77_010021 [Chytriomyces hyalinus]|nr:hypothetical protein HDU77_010021 [Chytriomyces hyalinus]
MDNKMKSTLKATDKIDRSAIYELRHPMRNLSAFDTAAVCVHSVLTASGIIEFMHLIYFIAIVEHRVNREKPVIFSWFNITLISLSVSMTSLHASSGACVLERPDLFDALIARAIAGLSLCFYELMYVWYTWLRSKVILKLKGRFRYNVAAVVVKIAPGIYGAQFIILCFHLYWPNLSSKPTTKLALNLATAIGGLALIIFDSIMLLAFTSFLRENQMESVDVVSSVEVSKRFSIIALYGMGSCIMLMITLVMYLVMAFASYHTLHENLLQALGHGVMHGSFSLLVGMKVALHSSDLNDQQTDWLARNRMGANNAARNELASMSERDAVQTVVAVCEVKSVDTERYSAGSTFQNAKKGFLNDTDKYSHNNADCKDFRLP